MLLKLRVVKALKLLNPAMILFKKRAALINYLNKLSGAGKTVGFVPTMGALHKGHISLIEKAKELCEIVVCSIFINPTQFNNKNDFEKYPVTVEQDIVLLEKIKTHILFLPSVDEIYPDGINELQHYELGYLENILEGFYRPNHFQGVCNVVHRLFDIVKPDAIFLGQKDYQQTLILKRMMQQYHPEIKILVEPTLRENDGLAMSSRNVRLNNDARIKATVIYKALQSIKQNINNENVETLKQNATNIILKNGFNKTDYVEICEAETLLPVNETHQHKKLIALVAAYINDVRLIDNILI